ncbi:MAG: TerD family protein [Synergistaceae bacterium]|nr:TerD family protein [Synergistaceae bacterium]
MLFIAFILAMCGAVFAFMAGFPIAAANAVQLNLIPASSLEFINSLAKNVGLSLDTVVAIQSPELVNAAWLLVGAAVVGLIGAIVCFIKNKFAAALLFIAGAACVASGFIADGKCGVAFAYAVVFLIAAVLAGVAKKEKNKTGGTTKTPSGPTIITDDKPISLNKDQAVNLSKSYHVSKLTAYLVWESGLDLDASAFMLTKDGKVSRNGDFIFYHNLNDRYGAMVHSPDDDGSGDDDGGESMEWIKVNLAQIPEQIERVVFTVTIYDRDNLDHGTFGQLSSAYIRLVDNAKNERELVRYKLSETFSNENAMIFAELAREGSDWTFKAIGEAFTGGLPGLCEKYGVTVQN